MKPKNLGGMTGEHAPQNRNFRIFFQIHFQIIEDCKMKIAISLVNLLKFVKGENEKDKQVF